MLAEAEEWYNDFSRGVEEQNLRDFQENPIKTYSSVFPTTDIHADNAGKVLQKTDCVESLTLNYTGWTKWGAHEIITFVKTSSTLSEVILSNTRHGADDDDETFQPVERRQRDAMTRTLTNLLQSISMNQNIKTLELQNILLEGKSTKAFCSFLQNTETIKTLTISNGLFGGGPDDFSLSEDSLLQATTAIGSNHSIRHLHFQSAGNPLLNSIFSQMAANRSNKSKWQTLTVEGENSYLDTHGLQKLLISAPSHLEQVSFKRVNLTPESMECLNRGLLSNRVVEDISFQACTFQKGEAEPLVRQLLEESTSLLYFNLDCRSLSDDSGIIEGLRYNTSITNCELSNLSDNPSIGDALRAVLTHNRCIDCIKLNGDADAIDNMDVRLMADGLKLNPIIDTIAIHECLFNNEGLAHLAHALIPPPAPQIDNDEVTFAPVDLEIQSTTITDGGLKHFATTIEDPNSRLRSLTLSLNTFGQTEGLMALMKALALNKQLQALHISCNEDVGIEVWRSMAKNLAKVDTLVRLELCFGITGEDIWRDLEPKIIYNIHSDILEGLSQNTTIQTVRFGSEMYVHSTDKDQEFWTGLSFYVMRNQLLALLPTQDEVSSVHAALKFVRRLVQKEIKHGVQWGINSDRPGVDPQKANELSEFSLQFICLRHMPHIISDVHSS